MLIATVLLQKSEGGGLGMGGGAGFMSSRGTANLLSRTTAILAAGFFVTSLFLIWLASYNRAPSLDHRHDAGLAIAARGRRNAGRAADLGRHPGLAEAVRPAAGDAGARRAIRAAGATVAIKRGGHAGRHLAPCMRQTPSIR